MDTPENQLEAAAQELAHRANLNITEAREAIRQIQTHFQPRAIQPHRHGPPETKQRAPKKLGLKRNAYQR